MSLIILSLSQDLAVHLLESNAVFRILYRNIDIGISHFKTVLLKRFFTYIFCHYCNAGIAFDF